MAKKVSVQCNHALKDPFACELKIPKEEYMMYLLGAYIEYITLFKIPNKYDFIDAVSQYNEQLKIWLESAGEFMLFASGIKTIQRIPEKYTEMPGIKRFSEMLAKQVKTSPILLGNTFYKSASLFSMLFTMRIYILEDNKLRIIGDPKSPFGIYTYVNRKEVFILYPKNYHERLFDTFVITQREKLRHCGHLYTSVKDAGIERIKEIYRNCKGCDERIYKEERKQLENELKMEKDQRICIKCRQIYKSCSECASCIVAWCNEKCTKGVINDMTNCEICKKKLVRKAVGMPSDITESQSVAPVAKLAQENVPLRKFNLPSIYLYLTGGIIEYNLLYAIEFFDYMKVQIPLISGIRDKSNLLELFSVISTYKSNYSQITNYENIPSLNQIIDTLQGSENKIQQTAGMNPVFNKIRVFSLLFSVNAHVILNEQLIKLGNYNTSTIYLKITGDTGEIVFPKSYSNNAFDKSTINTSTCLVHCGHPLVIDISSVNSHCEYLTALQNYSCRCGDTLYKCEKDTFQSRFLLENPNRCSMCGESTEDLIECGGCKLRWCRKECIDKLKAQNGRYQCFICKRVIKYTPSAESPKRNRDPVVRPTVFNISRRRRCTDGCVPTSGDVLDTCRRCFCLTQDFSSIDHMRCSHCQYFLAIENQLCGFCKTS